MSFGLGEFFSLACAFTWAVAAILFKKSGESLAPVPLNLFKNVLGLALLVLTVLALSGGAGPGIPAGAVLLAFLSGLLGIALGDTLYFRALNAIGASRTAIAQMLYTPFTIVLSTLFLAERLTLLQLAGVGLVLGGVLLVQYAREVAAVDVRAIRRGAIEAALAVLAMAAGIVMAKPLLERYDFLWIVALRIVGGVLGLLLFVAARRELASAWRAFAGVRHWPHVIAGSIMGTYVSMLLWLAGYKYTKASVAAVLNEMATVFMILLAAAFLHERLSRRQLGGAALAVAGVVLVVAP